jgi:multidrug resistance efflux pump
VPGGRAGGRDRERTHALAKDGLVAHDWDDRVESESRAAEAACAPPVGGGAREVAPGPVEASSTRTVLRAAFDGVVADTFIEEGEWTAPSPPALPIRRCST